MSLASSLRRLLLAALFLLALFGAPARAGDPKQAQRQVDNAKSYVDDGRFENAKQPLERAEQFLQGVDEATAAPIKKQIAELRARIEEGVRKEKAERIMGGALDRSLDSLQTELDRMGTSTGRVARVDEAKRRFWEQILKGDESVLDPPQKQELEKRWADVRAKAVKDDLDAGFAVVEKPLGKAEAMLKGEEDTGRSGFSSIEQQLGWAKEALEKAQKGDPRHAAMVARYNAAVTELKKQVEKATHDEVVGAALQNWKYVNENDPEERQGWEQEPLHTYEAWRKTNSDMMPKCRETHQMAARWLGEERVKKALKEYPQDAELLKAKAEADALLLKSAERFAEAIKGMIDEAGNHTKERPKDLLQETKYLKDNVERVLSECPPRAAAVAQVQGLMDRIEKEMAEFEANKQALTEKCKAAASDAWPGMADDFSGFVDMDPTDCVENIEGWKGKLVRFTDCSDRAGWEYTRGDCAMVTPVNGVPVGLIMDDGLEAALAKMEEATGLERGDYEDVIAVVEGTLKIQESEWVQAANDWFPKYMHTSPRCRIVAVKCTNVAVSGASGTCSLSDVDDMPTIEVVGKGAVPGGGGGFFGGLLKLVCGLGCCLVFLGAVGGGGWYVYQQQQQKAAAAQVAGGAAPAPAEGSPAGAAPPPAAPPPPVAPPPPPATPPAPPQA